MRMTPGASDAAAGAATLIAGGDVVDGTGAARRRADILIRGDRIVAVGELSDVRCDRRIDAGGLIVAPGFVDAHTHDDRALLSSPDMSAKISQGVTTVVTGNCGISLAPLAGREPVPPLNLLGDRRWFGFADVEAYACRLESEPAAVNAAMLVGHSTLRVAVMDDLARPATAAESARMAELLDEALQAGCVGMSTGLAYPTAAAAPTAEVVALAARLAACDGLYTTHMRDEGDRLLESVEETLEIGRRAAVRVVISHHKASGRGNWGKTRESLALIERARRTQKVDLDVYPYAATSTVLLPAFVERSERVTITWSEPHPEAEGRDLDALCEQWRCTRAEAIERLQPGGAIYHQLDEADLRRVLASPRAMIGSDGLPHDRFPHPRLWGTFPRVLGRYVRDEGLLSLEEAVHRMTGLPASVFGFEGRGYIAAGAYADVVVFDPESVIDRADYASPREPSQGIERVLVNGETVWCDGVWSGRRPGRLLRRH